MRQRAEWVKGWRHEHGGLVMKRLVVLLMTAAFVLFLWSGSAYGFVHPNSPPILGLPSWVRPAAGPLPSTTEMPAGGALAPSRIERGLGYSPGAVDLSEILRGVRIDEAAGPYPAYFDLWRNPPSGLPKVTAVRDQAGEGTCWAFAAFGSLESCMLPAEQWDFSEDNLVYFSGKDSSDLYDAGGNVALATAYLSRWAGPMRDADDPYLDGVHPTGLSPVKHIQEVLFLPPRANSTDNDSIKWALTTYGGVWAGMYAVMNLYGTDFSSSVWNAATSSYYCSTKYSNLSPSWHAVTIVGWDDDYAGGNFTPAAPGDGAFICKNSWGIDWGLPDPQDPGKHSGYFYISYYDANIATESAVFCGAEPTDNYDGRYDYDELGMTAELSTSRSWLANRFTATTNSSLSAVSFYALESDTPYAVFAGSSLTSLQQRATGTLAVPGYHTIALDAPVALQSGQDFVVAVRLLDVAPHEMAIERPKSGYPATAHAGESFYSSDGSTWTDLTANYAGTNVCVKAFTQPAAPVAPSVTYPNGGEIWSVGSSQTITWTPGNGGNVSIELSRTDGASWETLFASTANDGSQSWTVAGALSAQALVRISNDNGGDVSNAVFKITAAPVDTTPPITTATGYDDAWHNTDVHVNLTVVDTGSGPDRFEVSYDGRDWEAFDVDDYIGIIVTASAYHTNDGAHTVAYRGVDRAGNVETPKSCTVKIDTRKPTTRAPSSATGRRGRTAALKYQVLDTAPNGGTARVTIKLKNRVGKVVRTLGPYEDRAVNTPLTARFTVPRTWKQGTYKFYVYATDVAGNAQSKIGSNKLAVR